MKPPSTVWPGDMETKPAPDPLGRIQALVNTVERPGGADRLARLDDARPWLIATELVAPDIDVTSEDLALVRDVREGFRSLLIHNAGGVAPTADALTKLREVAAAGVARADVGDDGQVRSQAVGDTLAARLGALLFIVRDAQRDGSWSRLKACGNDECGWAFYDRSRNHGGTWCEMSSCGNKLKNRDFRARRRADGGGASS